MKLKKPAFQTPLAEANAPETSPANTARFIAAADRRPDTGKLTPATFRLPRPTTDTLEEEAARTGQNKTAILKAAIMAYGNLDENEKNKWLLESMKL
ncbi:stability/partitioning determinant [Ewingella americana]|nr:stability/partitioning determinant [Ewingella americana]